MFPSVLSIRMIYSKTVHFVYNAMNIVLLALDPIATTAKPVQHKRKRIILVF